MKGLRTSPLCLIRRREKGARAPSKRKFLDQGAVHFAFLFFLFFFFLPSFKQPHTTFYIYVVVSLSLYLPLASLARAAQFSSPCAYPSSLLILGTSKCTQQTPLVYASGRLCVPLICPPPSPRRRFIRCEFSTMCWREGGICPGYK